MYYTPSETHLEFILMCDGKHGSQFWFSRWLLVVPKPFIMVFCTPLIWDSDVTTFWVYHKYWGLFLNPLFSLFGLFIFSCFNSIPFRPDTLEGFNAWLVLSSFSEFSWLFLLVYASRWVLFIKPFIMENFKHIYVNTNYQISITQLKLLSVLCYYQYCGFHRFPLPLLRF